MDDVDAILSRARTGDGDRSREGDRQVRVLTSVCESLDRGGLGYALDWHRAVVFDEAVAACRYFALVSLENLLREAAAMAHHGGRRVDDMSVELFDVRYATYRERSRELHDAVAAKLAADPAAFSSP